MISTDKKQSDPEDKQTEFDPSTCTLKSFKRNKYFFSKLMTVSDFNLEQQYLNGKRYLLNRFISGVGAVCGLQVSNIWIDNEKDGKHVCRVTVTNGFAVDCCGREIIAIEEKGGTAECGSVIPYELIRSTYGKKIGLYLSRVDFDTDSIASRSNSSLCEEDAYCFSHIQEKYKLFFEPFDPPSIIRFDKFSYRLSDSVCITFIETTTEANGSSSPTGGYGDRNEPSIQLISSADPRGISILLNKDEKGSFSAVAKLSESSSDSRNNTLKVDIEKGDVITAKNNDVEAFAIVLSKYRCNDRAARKIADDYCKAMLSTCRQCSEKIDRNNDPKVLLAVIENNEGVLTIDREETWQYREITYNNAMLYDLLTHHMFDTNNPHNVSAEQIGLGPVCMTASNIATIKKYPEAVPGEQGSGTAGPAATDEEQSDSYYTVSEKIRYGLDLSLVCFSTPPHVSLARWNKDKETAEYMEDLALLKLFAKKPKRSQDPNRADYDGTWIEQYFETDPVVFKAIDIDRDGFRILTIWPRDSNENDITLKWWATSTLIYQKGMSSLSET